MIQELISFGLEETEAKVYVALLEQGMSSVTQITRQAGITRTLGYHTLDKLVEYGLVKSVSRETLSLKTYCVDHPNQLIHFVENKKRIWEKRYTDVQKILPKFLALYNTETPKVKELQGITEIVQYVSRETYVEDDAVYVVINAEESSIASTYFFDESIIRLHQEGTKNVLLVSSGGKHWLQQKYESIISTTIPPLSQLANMKGEIIVSKKKIIHISLSNQLPTAAIYYDDMLVSLVRASLLDLAR